MVERIKREHNLTKGQQIMLADGLPAMFLIPQAVRNQRRKDNPPIKNMKKELDSSEDHSHQTNTPTQEIKMAKKSKKSVARVSAKSKPETKAKKTTPKKSAAKKDNGATPHKRGDGPRPGSKMEVIHGLLTRAKGCTVKDILEATSWPSISVPATAELLGLKLKKEKAKGERTRYFGS